MNEGDLSDNAVLERSTDWKEDEMPACNGGKIPQGIHSMLTEPSWSAIR